MTFNTQVIDHIRNTGLIDEKDEQILKQLIKDSRQSTQSIADECNISRPTAHERIKKLHDKGIIDAFTVRFNYASCGLPLRVFILVGFDATQSEITQKEVAKLLSRLQYVVKVNIITGSHDFLVEVAVDYMETLVNVITEEMRSISGVGNTETLISFSQYQGGFLDHKRSTENEK